MGRHYKKRKRPSIRQHCGYHGKWNPLTVVDSTSGKWLKDTSKKKEPVTQVCVLNRAATRSVPVCPLCTRRMALVTNKFGHAFWACTEFPSCKGRRKTGIQPNNETPQLDLEYQEIFH